MILFITGIFIGGFMGVAVMALLNYNDKADVAEVKHGSWSIAIGYDPKRTVMCDRCQRMNYEPSNYCPNCGAKMDEKVERQCD